MPMDYIQGHALKIAVRFQGAFLTTEYSKWCAPRISDLWVGNRLI